MDKRIMVAAVMAGVSCVFLVSSIKPENVTTALNEAASVAPEQKVAPVAQHADSKKSALSDKAHLNKQSQELAQPLQASPRKLPGTAATVENKPKAVGRFGGTKFF